MNILRVLMNDIRPVRCSEHHMVVYRCRMCMARLVQIEQPRVGLVESWRKSKTPGSGIALLRREE